MRHVKQQYLSKKKFVTGLKLSGLAVALAGLMPLQALASEACNVSLSVAGVYGATPFFVGDELTFRSRIGAGLIADDDHPDHPWVDYTGIGYGLDCDPAGLVLGSECTATGHDVAFIGVSATTCTVEEGDGANFPPPESNNIVSVPVLNGVVRTEWDTALAKGETCTVDLKFRVDATAPGDLRITQAIGVPYNSGTPDDPLDDMTATCSNELKATGYAKTGFNVFTCDIDVIKQVSADGEEWVEATTIELDEQAYYRLVVENTGNAAFLGNMLVNDPTLSIVDASVASGGLAPGEFMTIASGEIPALTPEQSCTVQGPVVNVASVEAWCRGDIESPVAVSKVDDGTATLNCIPVEEPRVPKIQLVKDGDIDLGDDEMADDTDAINYTFDVTNIGNVELTQILLEDPLVGTITCDPANGTITLAPEATIQCTGSYTISAADIDRGYVDNKATVTGTSPEGVSPPTVTDDDTHRELIPTDPAIQIKKQISLTNAEPWMDADEVGDALETIFPASVYYRLIVKNIGNESLTNVLVNDDMLGIDDYSVGDLAVGEEVILTNGEIAALYAIDRCDTRDDFTNVAEVTGEYSPIPSVEPNTVMDSDPAVLSCVGVPAISIQKQISIDGLNWEDEEETSANPLSTTYYRIIVTNSGTEPLVGVTVTDDDLVPPFSYFIDDLAVGATLTLVAGDSDPLPDPPTIYFPELEVPDLCASPGDKMNTASVEGWNANDDTQKVSDSDPAKLICEGQPGIEVKKQVRSGAGAWHDADDIPNAVVGPMPLDVEYRIIVKNTGEVALKDVVVSDATLNISVLVGNLAIGEEVVLLSDCDGAPGCVSEPDLTWNNRCEVEGEYNNIANAVGFSVDNDSEASDDDPAWVVCTGTPAIQIIKEVGVCEANDDDGSDEEGECRLANGKSGSIVWYDGESPEQVSPADAWYKITIRNIGTEPLTEVDLADLDLGIYEVIGPLGVGESVVIDQGVLPELYVEMACKGEGEITNIANTSGVAPSGLVQSSDWATLICGEGEREDLCASGKPKTLRVEYDGDSDTDHDQEGNEVVIDPEDAVFDQSPLATVYIEVFDHKKKNPSMLGSYPDIAVGDKFDVSGPKPRIRPRMTFWIYDQPGKGGTLLQKVQFHTSCSQPLNHGDEFGAITITD